MFSRNVLIFSDQKFSFLKGHPRDIQASDTLNGPSKPAKRKNRLVFRHILECFLLLIRQVELKIIQRLVNVNLAVWSARPRDTVGRGSVLRLTPSDRSTFTLTDLVRAERVPGRRRVASWCRRGGFRRHVFALHGVAYLIRAHTGFHHVL